MSTQQQDGTVKIKNLIVYENEKSYCAFPSIEKLQNGNLIVVFRKAARRKKATHIDTTAKAVMVQSSDGGKTWKDEKTVYEYEDACEVQDPSIRQLSDGTLLVNFFKWRVGKDSSLPADARRNSRGYGGELRAWTEGTFVVRSYDRGNTWEKEAIKVDSPTGGVTCCTTEPVLELSDGELLIPLEGNYEGESQRALVMRSQDKGETWKDTSTVAYDPFGSLSFHEPTLLALPSGKIICMMRTHMKGELDYGYYLFQSESEDRGRTWSVPHKTDMWGHPANMLCLKNGNIFCAYGYRRPPYGIRACLSEDQGKTWNLKDEIVIRSDGKSFDLGYPSCIELPDGRILVVYYYHPLQEDWSEGHSLIAGSFVTL
ncbi:glycoside hydrolase [bacterium]|nr:glycoside hydrolase [bacterium]